jgi:hypothetical protein
MGTTKSSSRMDLAVEVRAVHPLDLDCLGLTSVPLLTGV